MTRSLTDDEEFWGIYMGAALIMKDRIVEAIEFTESGSPGFMGELPVLTPYARPSKGE